MSNTQLVNLFDLVAPRSWDDPFGDLFTHHIQAFEKLAPPTKFPYNYYIDAVSHAQVIEYALAGFSKEDISVKVSDGHIKIDATRPAGSLVDANGKALRRYIHGGLSNKNLTASWRINDTLNAKKLTVSFKDGLLKITIPKKKKKEAENFEVEIEG
jgi:HSP20 family protein